jgi:ribosomal protein L37AE/L43A
MAHIVDLAHYRKARKPARRDVVPAAASKPEPHFYCLRCEGDQFKLFSTGMVHCAHCGARMRNLSVADTPGAPGTEH